MFVLLIVQNEVIVKTFVVVITRKGDSGKTRNIPEGGVIVPLTDSVLRCIIFG